MSSIEQKILAVLQKGLPKSQSPFKDMAQQIGMDTGQLLAVLKDWKPGKWARYLQDLGRLVTPTNAILIKTGLIVYIRWSTPKVTKMFSGRFDE